MFSGLNEVTEIKDLGSFLVSKVLKNVTVIVIIITLNAKVIPPHNPKM